MDHNLNKKSLLGGDGSPLDTNVEMDKDRVLSNEVVEDGNKIPPPTETPEAPSSPTPTTIKKNTPPKPNVVERVQRSLVFPDAPSMTLRRGRSTGRRERLGRGGGGNLSFKRKVDKASTSTDEQGASKGKRKKIYKARNSTSPTGVTPQQKRQSTGDRPPDARLRAGQSHSGLEGGLYRDAVVVIPVMVTYKEGEHRAMTKDDLTRFRKALDQPLLNWIMTNPNQSWRYDLSKVNVLNQTVNLSSLLVLEYILKVDGDVNKSNQINDHGGRMYTT